MLIISQGAVFDISTISGTAQSVTIQFLNGDNQPLDVSGGSFRAGIRGPGAVGISVTASESADKAIMAWTKLKAGDYAYDVFMVSADGSERQILRGTISAEPRITPSSTEDVVTIADVVVIIPNDPSGTVTITDRTTSSADRAETAAKSAEASAILANASASSASTSASSASASASNAEKSANSAKSSLEAIPQVDASGNMTLEGGLTTAGAINANGGINVPVSPFNDNDVVRLIDISTPVNVLPLFSQKTVTPMRYVRGSAITVNGATVATGDTPLVLTNNRVIQKGDDNWGSQGFHTFVLELNPFRFSTLEADSPEEKSSQQDLGVRANFGLTSSPWNSAPDSIFSNMDLNDLLQPIKIHSNQWGYCPVASIWPGSASADFRARVGFQQCRQNSSRLIVNTEKLNQYLFACYDRRKIARIIQCYARQSPSLDPGHSYLFTQDRDGVIQLIGYVYHSYEWQTPCLWMTAHGSCGIQGCWHISQDCFNLLDVCKAGWPSSAVPDSGMSWPIQQSVFLAGSDGGTFIASITAADKTYTMSDDIPDWISYSDGDNDGDIILTASANDTGAERDGLVNLTLFNGVMYTIVIRQAA